jgi:hypothetical protein
MYKSNSMHRSNKGGMANAGRQSALTEAMHHTVAVERMRREMDTILLSGPVKVYTKEEILNFGRK